VGDEVAALSRIGKNPTAPDLTGKASNTVLNQQLVNDLRAGALPGVPIGGPGTPREMPMSSNPSVTAEDFAMRALGRQPTDAELAKGASMNKGNCPGCWSAQAADGTYVTYRPAGSASADTLATTASVGLNNPAIKALNAGRPELKLKFPGEPKP
jgi:filamentous hemagglutinin